MTAAFVDDLMDRSRLRAALGDTVRFAKAPSEASDAELVVVDLARHAHAVAAIRRAAPRARIVAFGPHVDDDALRSARTAGADVVMARSRFFRDVAAAVSPPTEQ